MTETQNSNSLCNEEPKNRIPLEVGAMTPELSIDTRKCSTHIHPHCTSNLRQHRATFATSLVVKRVFC